MPIKFSNVIKNREWLYRSFPVPDTRLNPPVFHYAVIQGKVRFSRGAWNDKNRQPSVDRAYMLSCPQDAKFNPNDPNEAIIKIRAAKIRKISSLSLNQSSSTRLIDVIFDPNISDNRPAHSKITADPIFEKKEKREWKMFQEFLSIAASKHGWVVPPHCEIGKSANSNGRLSCLRKRIFGWLRRILK